MIRFEKFDDAANRAIGVGVEQAQQMGCTYVGTEHLLYGLLADGHDGACALLRRRCGAPYKLAEWMTADTPRGMRTTLAYDQFSPRARRALQYAVVVSARTNSPMVTATHIAIALLEDGDCTAAAYIVSCGLNCGELLRAIPNVARPASAEAPERRTPHHAFWSKYGRDLTEAAARGDLAPVIGREKEMERVLCVLGRKSKNNPCLIGAAGVGKTAIVEGIAQRIADQIAPPFLQGKSIIALDMAAMVAGTKYRGDFEERFKNLLEELYRDRSTILFIDEIHVIAGAGAAEGAIDAASILKPMLARGEIQLIGATTPEEYRKTIQKDSALDRRFGMVNIEEPAPQQAEKILTGLMPRYERYHGVRIPQEAIRAAVELSVRYLPGRYLPDKAIDLLDEAAAALRISGGEQSMLPGSKMPVLTSAEIAKVVGKASGVPAERVGEAERVRLDQLEARLAAQVIGQPRAVHAVAAAIRRSRTGLREAGRPIGAMLFLGPTGVGKTQLARTLAQSWFGSEKALLRFDMSEYMEQHTVARLIGAPPGYVGHDEGGQLTEAVRRRPYSVVLFDEIEKAHSDIQNILLQILEDGTLTDAQGRKADFSNTIILLTSNLGARCLAGQASPLGFGAAAEETARRGKKALQEAKDYFRPELMGRLDDVVLFDPLGPAQLAAIADRLLCELEERAARQGYTLRHTPAAAAALAGDTVPAYGARELRRKVSRAVEQALADRIAAGTARPGVLFVADAAPDGHITLTMGDVAACAS